MFFKKDPEPEYIAITRALAEKFPEAATFDEVKERLEKKGVTVSEPTLHFALSQLGTVTSERGRLLNAEAYFNLLDHEELVMARQNSREARILSTIAILISVASLVFIWRGTSTVRLDKDQLMMLQDIKTSAPALDVSP